MSENLTREPWAHGKSLVTTKQRKCLVSTIMVPHTWTSSPTQKHAIEHWWPKRLADHSKSLPKCMVFKHRLEQRHIGDTYEDYKV